MGICPCWMPRVWTVLFVVVWSGVSVAPGFALSIDYQITPGNLQISGTYSLDTALASGSFGMWQLAFAAESSTGAPAANFACPPACGSLFNGGVSTVFALMLDGGAFDYGLEVLASDVFSARYRYRRDLTGASAMGGVAVEIAAVPEPATLLLLSGGLAGLAAWRMRRQAHR